MTCTRIRSGKEAQEVEGHCSSCNDMVLPTEYPWTDLEGNDTEEAQEAERPCITSDNMILPMSELEDDDTLEDVTSKRIWFGKEAQEVERPCTSWDDMILPTKYSWSDLEEEATQEDTLENYVYSSKISNTYYAEESKLEARREELNERPAPEYDTDDDWSSDDEDDCDSNSEYDGGEKFYEVAYEHFDDWPSYHQD
ncbi:hypothetical protein FVEN_g5985 [Fusarium venenatum]|uniref:Uncharacterized protein n=1 Tax=Fusarium venenatum TaxID=56646 RepID=A0A2L2SUV3_9HYPO|nr:uncharacterized protein FVRRES_05730 [Fusarium venenatum]KAG8356286.1 hypothetical protein FVEN_g5985 [Fusarium venenatum]KAH6992782.1 hypothetical protein EDB82DRAFT_474575 [Fusarium venenatum]CEI61294.1 unnamed protein product [Fusarium venenatum]